MRHNNNIFIRIAAIFVIMSAFVSIVMLAGNWSMKGVETSARNEWALAETLDLQTVLPACGIIAGDGGSHGSCVAIGPDLVLTAGHCIHPGKSCIEIDGQKYGIIDTWKSDKYDIAFVRVDGGLSYLEFGDMPSLLDSIYVIGSPLSDGEKINCINNVTKGRISNLNVDWFIWVDGIIVDVTAYPGNSGGPLLDKNGRIIGVMVGCHNRVHGGGDNFWLAESVDHIREALTKYYEVGRGEL